MAVLIVPRGFLAQLRSMLVSPSLVFETNRNAFRDRVVRQVQALVFDLNQRLQGAYIQQNVDYLGTLVHGGSVDFLGRHIDVLGLERSDGLLQGVAAATPAGSPAQRSIAGVRRFAHQATLALGEARASLEATAHPIALHEQERAGRSFLLGSQIEGYGLAVSLTFAGVLLAAGALALERDENVMGRLARGLVSPTALVVEKVLLVALTGLVLGALLAVAFALTVALSAGGGQAWSRLPLLVPALLLAAAAIGAVGTLLGGLARDLRTAAILALAITLPLVFLGIVPPQLSPAAAHLSTSSPSRPRRAPSAACCSRPRPPATSPGASRTSRR